ncbi:MAG: arginine N-succinyltransferase, partial [Gammaproteobacteria bacterium]|nr:arginine N-succinyltransferase [Gammaproteobacteria bacterium]NIR81660.1 arginine N-succinyltransferase [Gammaproteobacteria bacterium]NIR88211.1 arginine N-succinyltransferase [Gammaproteobacteria bacterium]NIU02772.1 arginine N-succinyltransferase [Gammaproteobacteria bacterium]NIV73371.1 arginine N-succinyltransferase [Gammaproteobacteria bacterium]
KPFYSYKILSLAHTSLELNKFDTVRVLQMVNEYQGATEIATLYLTPTYRRDGNGRLLSRSRFLYMAEFPSRFSDVVMAEMRGVHDAEGHSVFWDSLGRRFLGMEFNKADYLSSLGRYQFIADLMPAFPIYIRLLPDAAQGVIGAPHEDTRPALKLLEREGFRFEGCVDVFDAGPTIHAPREQIRTVAASRRAVVGETVDTLASHTHMIANTRAGDFRLCRGQLELRDDASVCLTRRVADALRIAPGDPVRFVEF